MNRDITTERRVGDGSRERPVPGRDRRAPGLTGEAQLPSARRPAKPSRRPRPGWPAQLPKSPVRPASPPRPPGPGRSGRPVRTGTTEQPDRQARTPVAQTPVRRGEGVQTHAAQRVLRRGTEHAGQVRRTSFVLLLLGLLGGGMVCLLVVNTTLAANSIEIRNLQQQNQTGTQRVQQLEQQVAAERSAAVIASEARKLGLRPDSKLTFIDLRTGKILTSPGTTKAELAGRLIPVTSAGLTATGKSATGAGQ
jgi:hypothetical protein